MLPGEPAASAARSTARSFAQGLRARLHPYKHVSSDTHNINTRYGYRCPRAGRTVRNSSLRVRRGPDHRDHGRGRTTRLAPLNPKHCIERRTRQQAAPAATLLLSRSDADIARHVTDTRHGSQRENGRLSPETDVRRHVRNLRGSSVCTVTACRELLRFC
ncbi:hypothetical protein EVAR_75082_1 [Eumeta japonica]|uniref:Uncharacterized protein n=1 Tax=Eumeta variegata TaxID=151549 RepID=A0A4C1W3H2_EUMVA|nr:hypothetical protein EVAR_75082_1 [Eumeta japonica]